MNPSTLLKMNQMNQMNMIPGLAVPKKFLSSRWQVLGLFAGKERDFSGLGGLIFGSSIYIRFILALFRKKPVINDLLNELDVLECTRVYIATFPILRHFSMVFDPSNELRKFIQVHQAGLGRDGRA